MLSLILFRNTIFRRSSSFDAHCFETKLTVNAPQVTTHLRRAEIGSVRPWFNKVNLIFSHSFSFHIFFIFTYLIINFLTNILEFLVFLLFSSFLYVNLYSLLSSFYLREKSKVKMNSIRKYTSTNFRNIFCSIWFF